MIDSQESHLPIFCDAFPTEYALWYSTSAKKPISNQEFLKKPDLIPTCLPFNKQNLDAFFADAKKQLTSFNHEVIAMIDQLAAYINNSLPEMKSSQFLAFLGKVKRLCGIAQGFKEERKEAEDFDWLFKGQYEPLELQVPELDAKLIDLNKEWGMIQSWFGD